MVHFNLSGSHYEAGRQLGTAMRAENNPVQQLAGTFPAERYAYARACLPIYEREAPELLDELRGLSAGAQLPFEEAAAFLLGMYAFPGGNHCTCFAVDTGKEVIFGRNSDFLTALEPLYLHCRYTLAGAFPLAGNTTVFCELEDGVNVHGLAVGLTFVYPTVCKPGWNAGYLVRRLLERCKTVTEALTELEQLTIGSSQTLTLADPSGMLAVAECNAERLVIRRPGAGTRFIAAVNDFRTPEMLPFRCTLEDSLHSGLRWQTAVRALRENRVKSIPDACTLLAGNYGFLCQYDRSRGFDTVWSAVYGLRSRELLLCEGNPSRGVFRKIQGFPV